MPSRPAAAAFAAIRLAPGNGRDSSRASRSGGATKITVSLIGEGLSAPPGSLVMVLRAGGLIEPVGVGSGTVVSEEARELQCSLPAQDRIELLLELLLIEELPAGNAIDLRAQFRDAILIGDLHMRLTRDQAGEHIVAEGKIASRQQRPRGHDDKRADHDPERQRTDPHLAAGMHERIVGGPSRAARSLASRTAVVVSRPM